MKIEYNKLIPALVCGIAVVAAGVLAPDRASSRLNTNVPADLSEKELRALVVEDFEQQTDWIIDAVPKKIADEKKNPVPALDLKYVEGGPSDLIEEKWSADKKGMEKKQSLGVHFRFKYPGYNSVHLLPPPEVQRRREYDGDDQRADTDVFAAVRADETAPVATEPTRSEG